MLKLSLHGLALAALVLSPSAGATQTGGPFSPNPGVLGGNRHAVMGVDQMGNGTSGVFPLDSSDKAISFRFGSEGYRSIDTIWLFYRSVGTPGPMRASLLDDDGGGRPVNAATVSTIVFAPHAAAPLGEWHELSLFPTTFKWLTPGSIYHLVIEPEAPVTPGNYVEIISARSRFPVPWQQFSGLGGLGPPPAALYDAAALMIDDDTQAGNGFLVERLHLQSFSPIFALEAEAGNSIGQPYDMHLEYSIHGDEVFGEKVVLRKSTRINWFTFFVRGWGFTGDPDPLDDLYFSIIRSDAGTNTLLHTQVMAPRTGNIYRGRSHWFSASFPEITLEPNVLYYFTLSSPGSAPDEGYVFSASCSSLPLPPTLTPTFGLDRTAAIRSTNGGQTFDVLALTSDTPFMYGYFRRPTPIAFHDEYTGHTNCPSSGQHYPKAAKPGETVSFLAIVRNIGIPSAPGEIYAKLIDYDSGAVLSTASYPALQTNTETGDVTGTPLEFVMPATDLRMVLETGHMEAGAEVADDWTPIEVRVDLECP